MRCFIGNHRDCILCQLLNKKIVRRRVIGVAIIGRLKSSRNKLVEERLENSLKKCEGQRGFKTQ